MDNTATTNQEKIAMKCCKEPSVYMLLLIPVEDVDGVGNCYANTSNACTLTERDIGERGVSKHVLNLQGEATYCAECDRFGVDIVEEGDEPERGPREFGCLEFRS